MSPEVPMFRRGRTSRLPQQQTGWPPQSFVAPFSWLLARDVEPGRDEPNFSTWDADDGDRSGPGGG